MKDFGIFRNVRKIIQAGDGYPDEFIGGTVVNSVSEDGQTWIEIYQEFSTFNGPFLISSEYPHFAVVEADGRIRMSYDDPSKVSPNDGDRIIASDEPFSIEHLYDPATGSISPPEPTREAVTAVSKAQAKLALLEAGLLDDVEAALSALEGVEGQRARIEWTDRTEFHRDHQFIGLLAAAIELSDEQIDALFERAAQL